MPWRMNDQRKRISFLTSVPMPLMIHRAVEVRGYTSNTHYIQMVLAEALAKDLGIPLAEIVDALPERRGQGSLPYLNIGPSTEDVKERKRAQG